MVLRLLTEAKAGLCLPGLLCWIWNTAWFGLFLCWTVNLPIECYFAALMCLIQPNPALRIKPSYWSASARLPHDGRLRRIYLALPCFLSQTPQWLDQSGVSNESDLGRGGGECRPTLLIKVPKLPCILNQCIKIFINTDSWFARWQAVDVLVEVVLVNSMFFLLDTLQ